MFTNNVIVHQTKGEGSCKKDGEGREIVALGKSCVMFGHLRERTECYDWLLASACVYVCTAISLPPYLPLSFHPPTPPSSLPSLPTDDTTRHIPPLYSCATRGDPRQTQPYRKSMTRATRLRLDARDEIKYASYVDILYFWLFTLQSTIHQQLIQHQVSPLTVYST